MPEIETIATLEELDSVLERSKDRPLWILKHSLTCGISATVFREYRRYVGQRSAADDTIYALIEIQRARPVSAALAERTGVAHQSPQALLLRDGRAVWSGSHYAVDAAALARASESTERDRDG